MSQGETTGRKTRELGAFYLEGDGVVIDHLDVGSGGDIVEILGVDEVNLSKGYPSEKFGRKDRVVVSNREFEMTDEVAVKIALRSPRNTISIRKDRKIESKFQAVIPSEVNGLVRCPNPSCISNSDGEGVPRRVYHSNEDGHTFTCRYCETKFDHGTVLDRKLLTYLV